MFTVGSEGPKTLKSPEPRSGHIAEQSHLPREKKLYDHCCQSGVKVCVCMSNIHTQQNWKVEHVQKQHGEADLPKQAMRSTTHMEGQMKAGCECLCSGAPLLF